MSPQSQTVTLNGSLLKKIGHASHTAEVVLLDLACRERLRTFSDIPRTRNKLIRDGNKIVEADYMAFWKGLQDAGVGVLVYERKGGPPARFEWHYSMKKVAKAAMEGTDEQVQKIVSDNVKQIKPVKKDTPKQAKAEKFVCIPLRKDFYLEFNIPSDISKDEIQMIERTLRRVSA
jgi:hypothetical protein